MTQDAQLPPGFEPSVMEPAFPDDQGGSYRVTADELRQFIERWERLDADNRCCAVLQTKDRNVSSTDHDAAN